MLISLSQSIMAQCTSCTVNITSNSSQSYTITRNDVICVKPGATLTGGINNIHKDGILCIDSGATFIAPFVDNWNGTIYNYGTIDLSSATIHGNGTLVNMGDIIMTDPNVNGNTSLTNSDGSSIKIIGDLSLSGNNTLINDGELTVTGDFNFNGSADFENNGSLIVEGELDLNKSLDNHGFLRVKGDIVSGSNGVHNYCMFISEKGFTNSGSSFANEGFMWIIRADSGLFSNTGTFYQAPGAQFRGVDFENTGEITGGGDYYFSGNTYNDGDVGFDSLGLNFYDASLANPNLFFDQQIVAPHISVNNDVVIPPDTNTWVKAGASYAGPDQWICKDFTTLNSTGTIGKWSIVTGDVKFNDKFDPQTGIFDVNNGINIIQWNEDGAVCGVGADKVKIRQENPADTTIWIGNIDNNWHESDNWTNCVPGTITVAIIKPSANDPEISNGKTGVALKVYMEANSAVTVKDGAKLRVAKP